MYVNIEEKSDHSSIEDLIKSQNERVKNESNLYYSSEKWKTKNKELIIRTLYKEYSSRIEYTAFNEFDDFIAYGVLITPIRKFKINLPKMIYTVENFLPMDMKINSDI